MSETKTPASVVEGFSSDEGFVTAETLQKETLNTRDNNFTLGNLLGVLNRNGPEAAKQLFKNQKATQ